MLFIFFLVILSLFWQPSPVMATNYGEKDYIIFSFGTKSLGMKIGLDANNSFYEIDRQIVSIEHLFGGNISNNGILNPHRFESWLMRDFWVVGGTNHRIPFLIVGYSLLVGYSFWEAFLARFFVEIIILIFTLFLCFVLVKKRHKNAHRRRWIFRCLRLAGWEIRTIRTSQNRISLKFR